MVILLLLIIILLLIKIAFFSTVSLIKVENKKNGQAKFLEPISPKERFDSAEDIDDYLEPRL
jgi:hypothetical protein